MDKDKIDKIVNLRQNLVSSFERLRDYKNNKNAIMKERDHAQLLHSIIVNLDDILSGLVEFSDKK